MTRDKLLARRKRVLAEPESKPPAAQTLTGCRGVAANEDGRGGRPTDRWTTGRRAAAGTTRRRRSGGLY
jgi:hypothetical protein